MGATASIAPAAVAIAMAVAAASTLAASASAVVPRGGQLESDPQVLARHRHQRLDRLCARSAAELDASGGPSLPVGRGRSRIHRGARHVIREVEGHVGAGHGEPVSVQHLHDEGIGERLALRAALPVAGDDGEGGGLAGTRQRKVTPAAGRGQEQKRQETGGRMCASHVLTMAVAPAAR